MCLIPKPYVYSQLEISLIEGNAWRETFPSAALSISFQTLTVNSFLLAYVAIFVIILKSVQITITTIIIRI